MSSTPRRSLRTLKKENKADEEELTTPVHSTPNSKHPDSPLYFPLTQESENEVVWDWQSPQQNRKISKTRAQKKHIEGSRSPSLVVPFKRKNLLNKINNLKEKLDAINQQINKKIVSDKKSNSIQEIDKVNFKKENRDSNNDLENLWEDDDDSFVDCLIECSQRIENEYLQNVQNKTNISEVKVSNNITGKNLQTSKLKNSDSKFGNDSFDQFLQNVQDDVIESLSQVPCKISENTVINVQSADNGEKLPYLKNMYANGHDNSYKNDNKISNLVQTNSFEFNIQLNSGSPPLKCTPDEIEKKRRNALAKRERKMMERPKSSMGIDGEVTPSRKFQRRNYSFEIPSPSGNDHKASRQMSSETLNETDKNNIKNIKDWEKIQREIEKKRQEAILRLQRKRIKK